MDHKPNIICKHIMVKIVPRMVPKNKSKFFSEIHINMKIGACTNDDKARKAARSLGYLLKYRNS